MAPETSTQRRRAPRTPIAQTPANDYVSQSLTSFTTEDRAIAMTWMEDGQTVVKRADGVYERTPGAAPASNEPAVNEFEGFPSLDVLERRLLDPGLASSAPILFKDEVHLKGSKPKWYKRWINTTIDGRLQTLVNRGGYQKATWSLVADKNEIGSRFEGAGDDIVRRGNKGQEVLIYMPYLYWEQIKLAQTKKRVDRERSSATGAVSVGEVAAGVGPMAAEMMSAKTQDGHPVFRGGATELRPMSADQFESTAMPKDAVGAVELE